MEKIFTFWEGKMPAYIKCCIDTWKFNYVLLTYDTLSAYTDLDIEGLKRFTLPQIADAIRVHVLRDNGGYWLDADTIMLNDLLPTENMMGYPKLRNATIGFLHTESNSEMFTEWAKYQDMVIQNADTEPTWDVMGNAFTDDYIKTHLDITIADISNCWAETYMIRGYPSRRDKYHQFYFNKHYKLEDLKPTNMLMLHNSWTPNWYKDLSKQDILDSDYTMSNILREVLK